MPITVIFHKYCKACFLNQDILIPLENLATIAATPSESVMDLSTTEHLNVPQRNSPLHIVTNVEEVIQVSTPRQERAKVRVNQDYQCPSVSKPLPNVWIPEYIKHLVSDNEADPESMLQSFHSRHDVMHSGRWTSINQLTYNNK